jgi:hypothetical protein
MQEAIDRQEQRRATAGKLRAAADDFERTAASLRRAAAKYDGTGAGNALPLKMRDARKATARAPSLPDGKSGQDAQRRGDARW